MLLLFLFAVSFLVSWMPYAVVSLLESFCNVDLFRISPMLVQLPCLMAKTACIWNPLVYVCHNSQFRDAFIERFGILKKFKTETGQESEAIGSSNSTCQVGKNNQCSVKVDTDGNLPNMFITDQRRKMESVKIFTQTLLEKAQESNV